MTAVDTIATKTEPQVPKRPLTDDEFYDIVDKRVLALEEAKREAAKFPAPASPPPAANTPAHATGNANPAASGDPVELKSPTSREDMATVISNVFGEAEFVYVSPDDSGIPEALQITSERAQMLEWNPPNQIVGLVCGASEQPLYAIVFTDRKEVAEFRDANAAFKDSLCTQWPRLRGAATMVLWFRCSDGIACNVVFGAITWVGRGIVPVAVPVWDPKTCMVQRGPIPTVQFSEIKWPSGMEKTFAVFRLEERTGPRYNCVNGKVSLNATFWAHWVAKESGIRFLVDEGVFIIEKEGKITRVPDIAIQIFTMERLRQASAVERFFPSASLRPAAAKQVVEEMKLALATLDPGQKETLLEFLDRRLERCHGQSLTVLEIYDHYRACCRAWSQPYYYPPKFQRVIAEVLERKFGVMKSHDIERTGEDGLQHARRGFHGLRLKEQVQKAADAPDGADAADAPDGTAQTSKTEAEPRQPENAEKVAI